MKKKRNKNSGPGEATQALVGQANDLLTYCHHTKEYWRNQAENLPLNDHLRLMLALIYVGYLTVRWNKKDEKLKQAYEWWCMELNKPAIYVVPRGPKNARVIIDWITATPDKRPRGKEIEEFCFFMGFLAPRDASVSGNQVSRLPIEAAHKLAELLVEKVGRTLR